MSYNLKTGTECFKMPTPEMSSYWLHQTRVHVSDLKQAWFFYPYLYWLYSLVGICCATFKHQALRKLKFSESNLSRSFFRSQLPRTFPPLSHHLPLCSWPRTRRGSVGLRQVRIAGLARATLVLLLRWAYGEAVPSLGQGALGSAAGGGRWCQGFRRTPGVQCSAWFLESGNLVCKTAVATTMQLIMQQYITNTFDTYRYYGRSGRTVGLFHQHCFWYDGIIECAHMILHDSSWWCTRILDESMMCVCVCMYPLILIESNFHVFYINYILMQNLTTIINNSYVHAKKDYLNTLVTTHYSLVTTH